MAVIHQETFDFLNQLSQNNNREWFNDNKALYLKAQENVSTFADTVITAMNQHDQIENTSGKKSLLRIYNDVRFKKDKTPYSPRFAFGLKRATEHNRGGYYMHLEPGNCFLGCGFFSPSPVDLLRIRKDIEAYSDDWYAILNNKTFQATYGSLLGDAVKTAPKGFSKEHPAIELLKFKQYIFKHDFTDKEVLALDFAEKTNAIFKVIRPWFDHMSEVLTTNLNGESIV